MADFLKGVWFVFVCVVVVAVCWMKWETRQRTAARNAEMYRFSTSRTAADQWLADFKARQEEKRREEEMRRILYLPPRPTWTDIRLSLPPEPVRLPAAPMPRAKAEVAPMPRAK